MNADEWTARMAEVLEMANYKPGQMTAPGPGPGDPTQGPDDGDDPLGQNPDKNGPLAYVLAEALDVMVTEGADRDEILATIAEEAGDPVSVDMINEVLEGDLRCPPQQLLTAFAAVANIDMETVTDAAVRGGCVSGYVARLLQAAREFGATRG